MLLFFYWTPFPWDLIPVGNFIPVKTTNKYKLERMLSLSKPVLKQVNWLPAALGSSVGENVADMTLLQEAA